MNAASCHVDAVAELLFQDGNYTRCVQHLFPKGFRLNGTTRCRRHDTHAGVRDLDIISPFSKTKTNDLETESNAQNASLRPKPHVIVLLRYIHLNES
jgi:hypothetical protein